MKKMNSLQLSRETIGHLDRGQLAAAHGAVEWTTIMTIYSVVVSCPQ